MSKHIPRLDSLRGIGALMVAGYHILPLTGALLWSLMNGLIGVNIFFVLSGLVLGKSLHKSGALSVTTFAHFFLRRLFRIYPAYFASTVLYGLIYLFLIHGAATGRWVGEGFLNYLLHSPLTQAELVGNFLFTSQALNNVTWTLKVEIFAALALPFFHQYSRCFGVTGRIVLLLALLGLSFLPLPPTQHTRVYLYLFYLGYLLSEMELFDPNHKATQSVGLLAGFSLLGALCLFATAHHLYFSNSAVAGWITPLAVLAGAGGSSLLLISVMAGSQSPLFGFLDYPLIRLVGITSYSFYLLHRFCLDLLQREWGLPMSFPYARDYPLIASIFLMISSCAVCLGGATLFYYFIERPFIKWGARFCDYALPKRSSLVPVSRPPCG